MDGTIFGGPIWQLVGAAILLVLGAGLVGCGVNVCWARWSRNPKRDAGRRNDLW